MDAHCRGSTVSATQRISACGFLRLPLCRRLPPATTYRQLMLFFHLDSYTLLSGLSRTFHLCALFCLVILPPGLHLDYRHLDRTIAGDGVAVTYLVLGRFYLPHLHHHLPPAPAVRSHRRSRMQQIRSPSSPRTFLRTHGYALTVVHNSRLSSRCLLIRSGLRFVAVSLISAPVAWILLTRSLYAYMTPRWDSDFYVPDFVSPAISDLFTFLPRVLFVTAWTGAADDGASHNCYSYGFYLRSILPCRSCLRSFYWSTLPHAPTPV